MTASGIASLPPQVLDKPEFTKCMLEKLVWISAFMLVGAQHGGCTVGEVEAQVGEGGGRMEEEAREDAIDERCCPHLTT